MAAALVAAACGPSATVDRAATEESFAHLRSSLDAYRASGFLVGPPDFPVVGRPLLLSGPADSVYVGFAASMPAAALQFAREEQLVAARYQVTLLVRSGPDTLRHVEHREVVRLTDFEEAASREPRILFQRFLLVPARPLRLQVTVRELASRRQVEQDFDLETPSGVSRPVVAYRAERRAASGELPAVVVSPRGTVLASLASPLVYVEHGDGPEGPLVLRVVRQGDEVWSDTLAMGRRDGGPPTAVAALPVHLLPPGRATLEAERPGEEGPGASSSSPLFVGLSPEWTPPTWDEAVAQLAYALPPDSLDRWRGAPAGEQPGLWRRFNSRSDPDPSTPANEFLALYFERMSSANDRFEEPGRAGWETDRGEVYVKLGAPDDERFVPPERQGDVPRIEWEYDESVPTQAVIVFEDTGEFGVYQMTPRSRLALRRVVQERASAADLPAGAVTP